MHAGSLSSLTGTLEYNGANAATNVISNTCASPTMTSLNVWSERGLLSYRSSGLQEAPQKITNHISTVYGCCTSMGILICQLKVCQSLTQF